MGPVGINVTDTVEGVPFNHRAGGAPLFTLPFCVIICRHEIISSCQSVSSEAASTCGSSVYALLFWVYYSGALGPVRNKRENTKICPVILRCVGSYSHRKRNSNQPIILAIIICKEVDGPACY